MKQVINFNNKNWPLPGQHADDNIPTRTFRINNDDIPSNLDVADYQG